VSILHILELIWFVGFAFGLWFMFDSICIEDDDYRIKAARFFIVAIWPVSLPVVLIAFLFNDWSK